MLYNIVADYQIERAILKAKSLNVPEDLLVSISVLGELILVNIHDRDFRG